LTYPNTLPRTYSPTGKLVDHWSDVRFNSPTHPPRKSERNLIMRRYRVCAVVVAAIVAPAALAQQDPKDLRVLYATDNIDAIQASRRGIEEGGNGRNKEALAQFQAALRHDPKCGPVYYQIAYTQSLLGANDEAIAAYKQAVAGDLNSTQGYRSASAVNLGWHYNRLGNLDESNRWYTRGVLEDFDNRFKNRALAYRSLAINLRAQKRPLPAAIAISQAYDDRARDCDMAMVRQYFDAIGKAEVARVLHVDDSGAKVSGRSEAVDLREAELGGKIEGTVRELLADPRGRFVIATIAEA